MELIKNLKEKIKRKVKLIWLKINRKKYISGAGKIYLDQNKMYPATLINPLKTIIYVLETLNINGIAVKNYLYGIENIDYKFLPYKEEDLKLYEDLILKNVEDSYELWVKYKNEETFNLHKEANVLLSKFREENKYYPNIKITFSTWYPGFLIGTGGESYEKLKQKLSYYFDIPVDVEIKEIRKSNNNYYVFEQYYKQYL